MKTRLLTIVATRIMLSMLLVGLTCSTLAQGVIIYKSNGTQEKLPYVAIDSIIPYYGDKNPVPLEEAKAVDLGLPSGTLWADRHVGAASPETLGGYFAFGETTEKATYTWSSYMCSESECGTSADPLFADGMLQVAEQWGIKTYSGSIAGTKYDVATQLWDDSWEMPSYEQYQELFENCTVEWVYINNVACKEFKGPNGNTVIFPVRGGYKVDLETKYNNDYSYTSYLWIDKFDYYNCYKTSYARITNTSQSVESYSVEARKCGLQVRPVKKK